MRGVLEIVNHPISQTFTQIFLLTEFQKFLEFLQKETFPVVSRCKEKGDKGNHEGVKRNPKKHPHNSEHPFIGISTTNIPIPYSGKHHKAIVHTGYINSNRLLILVVILHYPGMRLKVLVKPYETEHTTSEVKNQVNHPSHLQGLYL